jgi:protein-tyrosine kinase
MNASKTDRLVLTNGNLNSHFAEAYRALRANISFSSIDQPVKTIVVTSAAPREGKTMTALNLGIIIAQAGPRVLLVDADFHHPSLHHMLTGSSNGVRAKPGLSNLIVGNVTAAEAITTTPFTNLSILPAGAPPPNPSELLASQRMRTVMAELVQRADFVLLDSPPCLLYADAVVLSQVSDGILYVLRAGPQDRAAQHRVHKQLQQAKARVLGVVFNDVEVEDGASNYAYYYAGGRKRRG